MAGKKGFKKAVKTAKRKSPGDLDKSGKGPKNFKSMRRKAR